MSSVLVPLQRTLGVLAELDTTEMSDSGSTRTVLAITLLLVIAAAALGAITVWYWRTTVPDPEALAPLVDLTPKRKNPWWGRFRRSRRD